MILFVFGLSVFLAVHSISIVNRRWRDQTVVALGPRTWRGAYTLIAAGSFIIMCFGYSLTRLEPTILYQPPGWLRHVALILLVPVFPLMLAAYLPGRIKAAAKHPLLAATKLWALAHLLVNGTVADVLLFGGLLVWAVADRISFKHRPQTGVVLGRHSLRNDLVAVGAGLLIYTAFLFGLHNALFGVSPL